MKKSQKIVIGILITSIVITLPWYMFTCNLLLSTTTKTSAQVISYTYNYRGDYVPVFKYRDTSGKTYQSEGSFGYKNSRGWHPIPTPAIGSTQTVYYDNNHHDSILYLRDPFLLAVFFLPLAICLFAGLVFIVITYLLYRVGKSSRA